MLEQFVRSPLPAVGRLAFTHGAHCLVAASLLYGALALERSPRTAEWRPKLEHFLVYEVADAAFVSLGRTTKEMHWQHVVGS